MLYDTKCHTHKKEQVNEKGKAKIGTLQMISEKLEKHIKVALGFL